MVLLTTGVVDTDGKFAASIVDTDGKFATGINNTSGTGGKICCQCRNLSLVLLIPVVHLDMQISQQIFTKI
jgi:hypothetical protein